MTPSLESEKKVPKNSAVDYILPNGQDTRFEELLFSSKKTINLKYTSRNPFWQNMTSQNLIETFIIIPWSFSLIVCIYYLSIYWYEIIIHVILIEFCHVLTVTHWNLKILPYKKQAKAYLDESKHGFVEKLFFILIVDVDSVDEVLCYSTL